MILADRDLVEQGAEEILEGAREKEVGPPIEYVPYGIFGHFLMTRFVN